MSDVVTLSCSSWNPHVTASEQERAIDALERGDVLHFPRLAFVMQDDERQFLDPTVSGKAKNISLDPSTGSLRGSRVDDADSQRLKALLNRYATSSRDLLRSLLPTYETGLEQARTSFRPTEIVGRRTSWRKDDTRLHVDSFPSSPTQGRRILRVFTNVNPQGQTRNWRLGEPFESLASRYLPTIHDPVWGSDRVLALLGITKRRRTLYDHYMLRLHDRMKADAQYQSSIVQRAFEFPAGSTWMVFTDLVSHAAMSGQYALEQTFHLPVSVMRKPARAPLRVLENLRHRELA
jgi:hypothetical protein